MTTINTKKGFTLIELLVVIAIIGILSGVVLLNIVGARQKAHNVARLTDIDQIAKSLELYVTKSGVGALYPTSGGTNLWRCVGLTTVGAQCWGINFSAPSAAENTPATNINLALQDNITKIPKDPAVSAGNGDYYLYAGNLADMPSDWTAWGTFTPGVYLYWQVDNFGPGSCGRGRTTVEPAANAAKRACALYLGK